MWHEFGAVTANSCAFWVPAQFVNFRFVPLHLRPLYLNAGMVLWTAYLSIASHRSYQLAAAARSPPPPPAAAAAGKSAAGDGGR